MATCPNCGEIVMEGDPYCSNCGATFIWSDDDDERKPPEEQPQYNNRDEELGKEAWKYYMDFKDDAALACINRALYLNDRHAANWNRKAIILEGMKRYAESEKCYNRSLELSANNLVYDNKARMLYGWAVHLREESKKLPNGLDMLSEAYDKVIKAMNTLPGENSEEDVERYLQLIDSINFYIDYEKKFQGNLENLKKYDKSELFTIAGRKFYKNGIDLTPGMPLKLVKEPDNESDRDAIAVYAQNEKVGYVANKDYTKFELTSLASELQERIENDAQAKYLFYLDRYAEIQFHIARIVK